MAVVVTFEDLHVYAYIGQRIAEREGVNRSKSPVRKRLRRKFWGEIRAHKGYSVFWGKMGLNRHARIGVLRREPRESKACTYGGFL